MRRKIEGKAWLRAKNRRMNKSDSEGKAPGLLEPGDGGKGCVFLKRVVEFDARGTGGHDDIGEEEEEEMTDLPGGRRGQDLIDWVRSAPTSFPYIILIVLCRLCSGSSLQLPSTGPAASPSFAVCRLTNSFAVEPIFCVSLYLVYNACVRNSKKPWRFARTDDIYNILALERAAKQEGQEVLDI